MTRTHHHPCFYAPRCTNVVECSGEWHRNHDGVPDTICDAYHLPGGDVDPLPCEDCNASICLQCGSVTRIDTHDTRCPQHPDYVELPAAM
jgi:hypothetical protein